MESLESQPCVFLGLKVKPGPVERHKLENFTLENTVSLLKNEAAKKTNIPSTNLELIHHGKILKDESTLLDSGIKSGEMVHVIKKKVQNPPPPPTIYSDAELQMLNNSLRTLGCTPNAAGWTRAMQLLNEESAMTEIIEHAPSLCEDCMTISILHEVELLAALAANLQTMRRGAEAHPDLPNALRQLMRLVRSRSNVPTSETAPTSGFAYSLEALSEDEDAEEEETEESESRSAITQEQLAAALQAATEAVLSSSNRGTGSGAVGQERLLRLLQTAAEPDGSSPPAPSARSPAAAGAVASAGASGAITAEMFSSAISDALTRANPAGTPMDQSAAASSSQSPVQREDFSAQLQHMHEMGLLDDALNLRALRICSGDVNAAINLVFTGED
ncbi:ubiquitin-like protein 7 isoform X1 [Pararge aegeria]|uniref:Jg14771 protein n=2 Tax=Pararge aegeria TaxID=116150 RepID=A0A8S4SNN9_9NEOP|nr:ubiquitin-like protein 7 isoform X1 [Pararge aegeria]CAH2267305.1 jg14771 [Pararge aegeria aegeria]